MRSTELALVGCGMMGRRHLRGYAELESVAPGTVHIAALCDPSADAGQAAAQEVEDLLGYRPPVFSSALEALTSGTTIEAADVVTDNKSHPAVVIPLLEAGVPVQVEKPLAVTIADGLAMVEAAERS